jgi:hypothetical protein
MKPTRVRLQTPDGKPILGTLERLEGRGEAETYEVQEDGSLDPEWSGSTEVFWDGQTTATTPDGKVIYLDSEGQEWTLDQLTQIPVPLTDDEEG